MSRVLSGFLQLLWQATRGRFLVATGLLLVAGLTEGFSLILIVPIVASAAPDSAQQLSSFPIIGEWLAELSLSLESLLGLLIVFVIAQACLLRSKTMYNARLMQTAMNRIRYSLFRCMGVARWEAFTRHRLSDLNYVLLGETDRVLAAVNSMQAVIQAVILLMVYTILAFIVSWQMALFTSVAGLLLFACLYPLRRRASVYGRELTTIYERRSATIFDFLSGMRIAKAFTAEDAYAARFREHLTSIRTAMIDYASLSTLGTLFFQIASAFLAAAFVWLSINWLQLEIAQLVLLIVIFVRLVPRFMSVQDNVQLFLTNLPAYERFDAIVQSFVTERELIADVGGAPLRLDTAIQLNCVGKIYDGASRPSVLDVSFSIAAKRLTVLIGPSGSGKSTIADMLLGLTRPSTGSIMIDSVTLDDGNRRSWREAVAVVPQDTFLFNESIAANLRIARQDATDADLWTALDQAHVGDLIRSLPERLATMVGERGGRFSGGERQRIALARALLRRPQLLLLDEATSALDPESQRRIGTAIAELRGKLTIVMIAHQPLMVRLADEIIALEDGRVVDARSAEQFRSRSDLRTDAICPADSETITG